MRPNIVSSLALLDKDSAIPAVDCDLVPDFVYTHCNTSLAHTETAQKHDGLAYITTTLYDLIASLQTLAAPDDAYIVSVITQWLCTGQLCPARDGQLLRRDHD